MVATLAATMTTPPASPRPHTIAAAVIGGAALTGALIGWALIRIAYRLDRFAANDGAGEPVWSLAFTNAAFPFTVVVGVVAAFTAGFAGLAAAVVIDQHTHARAVARQHRILAAGTTTPLLRRPTPPTLSTTSTKEHSR